jgi:vitamin B12 transporter
MPSIRSLTLVAALLILPTAGLVAQQRDTTQSDSARLAPVVVTATREPTRIDATSQAVIVLRGDELRARGVATVADALREVPGATVSRTGSQGGVTSLYLRGGESRYTKVLVDGVPINTVGGTVFLQNLTLDNVDRIEVVEGPASALYGADAMTGVIQIFTRRGGDRGADVAMDGGSYGTRDATASVRAGTALADLSLGGGWHHTDGIVAFNNGYTNGTLSAAATVRRSSGPTIRMTSRYTGATYHFPTDYAGNVGDTSAYTREHRVIVGLDASQRVGSMVTLRLLGGDMEVHGLSEDRQSAFGTTSGAYTASHDLSYGARRSAEVRAELALPGATRITIGLPYERESESTSSTDDAFASRAAALPTSSTTSASFGARTTRGAYGAVQGEPTSWLAYDASARYDDHSDYRAIATYHGGLSVSPWKGARLRAAYGTGFNAPAFYETLGSAYNLANRDLQPEQTHSVDLGLEQSTVDDRVQLHLGIFDQHFTQLIQYTTLAPDAGGNSASIYENLTSARSHGYEGGIRLFPFDGLTASAGYTQTIARVISVPPSYQGSSAAGDALLRRPSHTGNALVAYAHRGWSGGIVVTYVGSRPDLDFQQYPSPTVSLPAYTTVDLSAAAPLLVRSGTTIALTARVENALDRSYQEILNFPAPGRTVLVGARLTTR